METNQDRNPANKSVAEMIKTGKDNPANGTAAHEAAEADMQQDVDLQDSNDKGNELDEGELARLDGEK